MPANGWKDGPWFDCCAGQVGIEIRTLCRVLVIIRCSNGSRRRRWRGAGRSGQPVCQTALALNTYNADLTLGKRGPVDHNNQLEFDLRRTVLLGEYMKAWGMPEYRTVTTKGSHRVEVYYFPAPGGSAVHRYATVGVSDARRADGTRIAWELLMVTPPDNGGASMDDVITYLLDIMAYSLDERVNFGIDSVYPATPLAPAAWQARAMLIDAPRAEPEYLEQLHFAAQCIELLWVVPIHQSEFDAIKARGIDVFFDAVEASDLSVADPARLAFL
jgi:hypothetical protein